MLDTVRLYQTLVETSPDAIVLVAPDGIIQLANSCAAELHGFERARELIGVNMFTLIYHEEHASAIEQLGSAVKLGTVRNIVHRLLKADGNIFSAELSVSAIRTDEGTPEAFVCIVRDISDRIFAQEQINFLLNDLKRASAELEQAYDNTLRGWTLALDLRDKETLGHSKRVTGLTVSLAYEMGIREEHLIHIWRGALLHDIGKMGIPDSILQKPGPLTDEEWVIMRKHPAYAKTLIESISFLHPSLDIPYCHHEKWDGSGYPSGLKGTDIPLPARIFAIVDVWDALRSDRPYRPAMSEDVVRSYIQSQSGTHFDPEIVEKFLSMDLRHYEHATVPNLHLLDLETDLAHGPLHELVGSVSSTPTFSYYEASQC